MTELLQQVSAITGLAEGAIWPAALVFLRVGAMVSLLPGLGEQVMSMRLRLVAALALSAIVFPAVAAGETGPDGLAGPILAEALTGLALGFSLRVLVFALQTAGSIAAQSTSLAQMFAGTGPDPQPIIANLLVFAGIAIFVANDGLARAAELLILSYDIVPIGEFARADAMASYGLAGVARAFGLAFSLAAPFVMAALLYNLALGAINRAMPQLMVTFIGAPALTLGSLALLALAAPLMLSAWQTALTASLSQPFGG